MVDREIVREWLAKAGEDFDFASVNLKEDNKFYSQICFHFQQSAEKYLKAFIVAHELEFGKMHNLVQLLKVCGKKEPALLSLMEHCEILTGAYIDTRYPVHWPADYSREKALKMQAAANEIGEAIKKVLSDRSIT